MLVVARRAEPGQDEILIGTNARVVVISNEDGTIKIGVEAPKDVSILRGEIADRFPMTGEVQRGE
jgi:carbon storage regulator CsrA